MGRAMRFGLASGVGLSARKSWRFPYARSTNDIGPMRMVEFGGKQISEIRGPKVSFSAVTPLAFVRWAL